MALEPLHLQEVEPKSERFEMRLDPRMAEEVDAWRAKQAGVPSRAEAIRRLIEAGLSVSEGRRLVLSGGDTLVIHMLCSIFRQLGIDDDIDHNFIEKALHGGHYWSLSWQYPGIFHDHVDSEVIVREVVRVLGMWDLIESSYAKLASAQKKKVDEEGARPSFCGFDGNKEGEHLGIAAFLIEELERFSSFKGRHLNSHSPSIGRYRRMMSLFEPMRQNFAVGGDLNAERSSDC